MDIPNSHPRYHSLVTRERLIEGVTKGITSQMGLIAQGRGEAFDYLLGERTVQAAKTATRAAVATILLAKKPVFSVNGNAAVLAPDDIINISKKLDMIIEINIFHRTQERMDLLYDFLKRRAGEKIEILGLEPDRKLSHVDHPRALCTKRGIYSADLIFVPLEDGDRAEALKKMGKTVIVVDLNPLSRSARCAHITIVDNLTRVLKNMDKIAEELVGWREEGLRELRDTFSNEENLRACVDEIVEYLKKAV